MNLPIVTVIAKPVKNFASAISHHTATMVVTTFVSHNLVAVSVAGAIFVSLCVIGAVNIVNHNNGKSDAVQTQPTKPADSKNNDPDAPTILVKDPETGETRAVSQNDIKNNPSLQNSIIKTPTATDYQNAGIPPPSNTSTGNETSNNDIPSQPATRDSHTTQTNINGNTNIESASFDNLSDGNGGRLCTGTGIRVGFNTSTTYYLGGSTTPTIPSRQYDMNCKRYEYVSSGNGAYSTPSGSANGFFTFYALYQYQPVIFTYQTRKISCTIHTHQTNLLNTNTGQYYDKDYDVPYGFTDNYPTSSVGYTGQEPCSFLRSNGTMTNISVRATYDVNNSWVVATSLFGIDALYND